MRPIALLLLLALASPLRAEMTTESYTELVKRVQIRLHLHGFDPGPINGRNEGATQAALAQFQISQGLPASGGLDEKTLEALDVSSDGADEENASAGAGMPLARP